ncbi:extracellular solute-binding protein [Acidothermaceae bacterium B102]|nr:extracellular solute-binding protein [Acidothermaceae bacterium B102]
MTDLKFFAPDTDPFVASVLAHVDEFESATQHRVTAHIVGSDPYFDNAIEAELLSGDGADVFMSGPVLLWEHLPRGVVEPLDAYLDKADPGWDFDDFLPNVVNANRWTGRFGDAIGTGPLLAIPVNCETYNLAYNAPLLDQLGLRVPSTWGEYFSVAGQIAHETADVRGFAQRGLSAWHTMYTGFATQLWSYGGEDFDGTGNAAVDSDQAVRATVDFVEALRLSGPRDWTNQRWYELAIDFAQGGYGLIVDSDHYSPFYEALGSPMAGKVGYAPTPTGPTGNRTPNLWTWSLVMNARSSRKEAAWQFIQWASSPAFLTRAATEGNFNPTRRSVWESPAFLSMTEHWGNYATVSRRLLEHDARVLVTPAVNYRAVAEVWVSALRDAYTGGDTAQLLTAAGKSMTSLVNRSFGGI